MRSWSSELLTVSMVLSVPMGLALVFPHAAFGFKARPDGGYREPFAAFVRLSSEDERTALASAKSAWRSSSAAVVDERFGSLALGTLPAETHAAGPLLSVGDRTSAPPPAFVGFAPPPFLPSAAASPPALIAPEEKTAEQPVFPREDLLKIN